MRAERSILSSRALTGNLTRNYRLHFSCHAAAGLTPEQRVSRRGLSVCVALSTLLTAFPQESQALGFKKEIRKRRGVIDPDLYTSLDNGLKIFDVEGGKGEEISKGTRLRVHFDCRYRGIDVVSSRAAQLLGGNRIIAQPLDFVAGESVSVSGAQVDDRGGGGLFSGAAGPQPPPALSVAVYGMKEGGRRSVIVPPELGYGSKGMQEIPPDTPFELLIEILDVFE